MYEPETRIAGTRVDPRWTPYPHLRVAGVETDLQAVMRRTSGSRQSNLVSTSRCFDHQRYHPLRSDRFMANNHLYHHQLQQLNPIPIAPLSNHPGSHLYHPQQSIPQPNLNQATQVPRKRPKYSRSKLGCLSCRVRKVKCDEIRPICTRCAHSQRDCTWPAEAPKSKKNNSHSASESAPNSRPSTSSGQAAPSLSDTEWQSDSGAPGPMRGLSAGQGASGHHIRTASLGALRGRELAMASGAGLARNASTSQSRSRDRSPNPFAFNVHQLGPAASGMPHGQHQRSASSSSTASNSSISSLPYPLLPQQVQPAISINVPTSQTSSPSSAAFTQSPTLAWPPAVNDAVYGPRPNTGSSSIVAGFGSMDLNQLGATHMNSGLDPNAYPTSNDFNFGTFDGNNGFGNVFSDPMTYGNMDGSVTNGFEGQPNFNGGANQGLDQSAFLAQLQSLGSDGASYISDPSLSGSSAGSPDMDVEQLVGLDPRNLSSSGLQYNPGQQGPGFAGGGTSPSNGPVYGSVPTSMSGFQEAQPPMAAPEFGLLRSMPAQNQREDGTQQLQTTGYGANSSSNNNLSPFGTNLDLPQLLRPHQLATSVQRPYGPASTAFQPSPTMGSSMSMDTMSSPTRANTSVSQLTKMSSPTALGSASARILQQPHPSGTSPNGAGLQTSPYLQSSGDGVAAALYMPAVPAGPQDLVGSPDSKNRTRMRNGMGNLVTSDLDPSLSASLPMADFSLVEAVQGLSPSETPRPNFQLQQQSIYPQQNLQQPTLMGSLFGSPPQTAAIPQQQATSQQFLQSPPSQQSQRRMSHTRSRSDTITPKNAMEMSKLAVASGLVDEEQGSDLYFNTENTNSSDDEVDVSAGQWSTLSSLGRRLIANPDVLAPCFKTVQERNLIRHYVQTSTKLMMALPSSLNPILSIHLPIILSSLPTAPLTPPNASLVSPPTSPDVSGSLSATYQLLDQGNGSWQQSQSLHASIEALRLSLLGVASIHQAYLLLKSGPETTARGTEMWALARSLRVSASKHLGVAVATVEGCRSDAALGACVSIALIDIFMGGANYTQNLDLAKTLVQIRGGPEAIVLHSKASIRGGPSTPSFEGPTHIVEGGSSSPPGANGESKPKKAVLISSARLLLEILTVYDTFSTLTSGQQPALLRPGDSAWWFEGDKSNYHLFSIENMFGMSRSIVELFARVSAFLNRHRHPPESNSFVAVQGHLTPGSSRPSTPTASLVGLTETQPPPGSPLSELHKEACALLREVETWEDTTQSVDSMHPRIRYGNYAHKSALLILLLREAFNLPANDLRVQKCAEMTLLAAVKASADFVMSVDLTWPVIIAGSQCSNALRTMTVQVLEGFRNQCCFEIDTSESILAEVWRRMDAGEPRADFRGVVEDLDLRVLIL